MVSIVLPPQKQKRELDEPPAQVFRVLRRINDGLPCSVLQPNQTVGKFSRSQHALPSRVDLEGPVCTVDGNHRCGPDPDARRSTLNHFCHRWV